MKIGQMYKTGCKILMMNSILFIIIGIYGVLFNNTPLFSGIDRLMDPNFWGNEILSKGTINFKIFTWDYLGMFHIIWGINIWFVVRYGLVKKKEAWAWKSIFISVIVWLFVDIYFALTIKQNIFLFGSIFSILCFFIIPLIMTKDALEKRDMVK